jgi:ABC-type multidrug transport system ATPase subunit
VVIAGPAVDAVGARLMKEILLDQVRRGATMFLTSHVLRVLGTDHSAETLDWL